MKSERDLPQAELPKWTRWLGPARPLLVDRRLWRWHREGVARGMALGLFIGLLVPLGQTPVAALLTIPARAHLLTAAGATLITNPITYPAIYFAAFRAGEFLLLSAGLKTVPAASSAQLDGGTLAWILGVSGPLVLGLFVFAIVAGAAGYVGVKLCWRFWVAQRWARRGVGRCGIVA